MRQTKEIAKVSATCEITGESVKYQFWEITYYPGKEDPFTKAGQEIGCSKQDNCEIECFWNGSNDKSKDYLKID